MFSRSITELKPWTDEGMFDNINGQSFRDGYGDQDRSMTAVARALFARRLPEGESFNIKIQNLPSENTAEDLETYLSQAVSNATDGSVHSVDDLQNMVIIVQNRDGSDEAVEAVKKAAEERFVPNHPGWEIHAKAEAFLNKEMKTRVLIQKEHKAALVITGRLTMPYWHLIGSMLPTYVPALFENEVVNDKEKAVLKSLALHGSNTFVTAMAALEDQYDIRGKRIAAMVGGFELRERDNQVSLVDNEIDQIRGRMDDLMRRYNECIQQMDNANVRRAGLKYLRDNTDNGDNLVEFFQSNKCLDVVEVYGSRISFIVRTYYENFDPDDYEHFRTNETWLSELTPRNGVFSSAENCRKVMDAMFIDNKIRLKMCAIFHLDIRGSVSTTTGYSYPPNCANHIPNYHLDHHHCFGNYERVITDYLRNADTLGAINACIASAKAINIAESGATFNPMMKQVFQSTKACFELPDGTCVTPAAALEWLNAQEGGSENETDTADA